MSEANVDNDEASPEGIELISIQNQSEIRKEIEIVKDENENNDL